MLLREEAPADVEAIRRIVEHAFGRPEEAALVDALRDSGDTVLSLVAEEAGALVGHVLFSRMEAPMRALGLAPVAVMPGAQRRGVGGALIREGLARARQGGWEAVFVLGEPPYYERFGFTAAAASGFRSPYAGPYFMALALRGPELSPREGAVAYARPFAALG
ncbi:GNAT family N-acetyltransferase [Melittangium boletus]|uniref:GCN5 family acetyltransferase n=1 Tax=Melittangium boletus DSM 14713 TaxID=1294270 RepID=A0A250IMR3_9BACT|nr:N-acetyltransferase [Melittangium boletus]ATB32226.1 GCN5 family acetyltransferase [Melittangium boletus DSM 14713]